MIRITEFQFAGSARSALAGFSLALLLSLLLAGCTSSLTAMSEHIDRTLERRDHIFFYEEDTTELMLQSARGDINKVRALLDSGVVSDKRNVNGDSALMFAAEYGNLTIVKMLVEYGADVGAKNGYGHTPLFVATNNRLTNGHFYLEAMEKVDISYVGEGNHIGVMDYLMSIDAPIYDSLGYAYDAEDTGRAFFNIGERYAQAQKYAPAQDYLGIAMRGFLVASELLQEQYRTGEDFLNPNPMIGVASVVLIGTAIYAAQSPEIGISQQRFDEAISLGARGLSETLNQPPMIDGGDPVPDADGNPALSPFALRQNTYLILARENAERAILVGVMLECYKNETPDDDLAGCLKLTKAGFKSIDDKSSSPSFCRLWKIDCETPKEAR